MEENKNINSKFNSKKERYIKVMEKPIKICKKIFGYGILTSLFIGGLSLFGFIVAFIFGGEVAISICSFIKTYLITFITYLSTIMVIFGLIIMYLSGEVALTIKKKNNNQKNTEKTN